MTEGFTDEKGPRRKRSRGSSAFVPTREQRKLVKQLAGFGMTHERICLTVENPRTGLPISRPTLERAFSHELAVGTMAMDARVIKSMAHQIDQGNVTMLIWYSKNRWGWRDVIEGGATSYHVHKDNVTIRISKEELAKKLEERGLPPSLFGVDKPKLLDSNDEANSNGGAGAG